MELDQPNVTTSYNLNYVYNRFVEIFAGLYDVTFPK